MVHKGFLKTSFLLGALSVILGALGAHSLKKILSPESLELFETAVKYQFYHVMALFAAGILYRYAQHKMVIWAGRFFLAGILLFCGSLYIMSFILPEGKKLGMITPVGGVFFITGWLLLFNAVSKISNTD